MKPLLSKAALYLPAVLFGLLLFVGGYLFTSAYLPQPVERVETLCANPMFPFCASRLSIIGMTVGLFGSTLVFDGWLNAVAYFFFLFGIAIVGLLGSRLLNYSIPRKRLLLLPAYVLFGAALASGMLLAISAYYGLALEYILGQSGVTFAMGGALLGIFVDFASVMVARSAASRKAIGFPVSMLLLVFTVGSVFVVLVDILSLAGGNPAHVLSLMVTFLLVGSSGMAPKKRVSQPSDLAAGRHV